jgi:transcriptional regulator with PAS, ATPase and Fis domain
MLVEHFLSLERPPRSAASISQDVWDMLLAHRWPGNVRELRNTVQRILVTPERVLSAMAGSAASDERSSNPAELTPLRVARRDASDEFELRYLQNVLERTGGNVTRAAAIAEVSRQMIQKLMRKHGLREDR